MFTGGTCLSLFFENPGDTFLPYLKYGVLRERKSAFGVINLSLKYNGYMRKPSLAW